MKKSFVFLPMLVLLTSCGTLTMGFTEDSHEPGLDGSQPSQRKDTPPEEYNYFSGDSIDTSSSTEATLTFNVTSSSEPTENAEIADLVSCSADGLFNSVKDFVNVKTDSEKGLFIGVDSGYADGYLTLAFNSPIKDVAIEAFPYYFEPHAWNDDKVKIDTTVGVGINSSNYVKLNSEFDEEQEMAKTTNCRFHFSESLSEFTIKVGPQRAFIKKISLYY